MCKKITILFICGLLSGLAGTANAASCNVSDVTIDGMSAYSCGWGADNVANTPTNTPQLPNDYLLWDVNNDGDIENWQFYYKQDLNNEPYPGGTTTADISSGADAINLQITSTGGDNNWSTGTFSVNAYDPLLIVLGDGSGTLYHWYLFMGKTGELDGTWGDIFGGKDVSNITAYAIDGDGLVPPVPVPAAVWLFGSGLLGLVGVARRKRV